VLLDTTFLIDAERAKSALDSIIEDDDDVAIAAITIAELRVCVELSKGKTRRSRQDFLDDVISVIPILNYDLLVAQAHAKLMAAVRHQGRARGAHDLIIAATALASDRSVITADQTAFAELPGLSSHVYLR